MKSQTVLEVYQQFIQTNACQANPKLIPNLRTTLRHYVLPYFNRFSVEELQNSLEDCLSQVSINEMLSNAAQLLILLEQDPIPATNQTIAKGTIANYRSVLLRFLNEMYPHALDGWVVNNDIPDQAPSLHISQSIARPKRSRRKINMSAYALREEELTRSLKKQLDQMQDFWIKPHALESYGVRLHKETLMGYRSSILRMLGWHRNVQKMDLSSLMLENVVEIKHLKAFIDWGMHQRGNGIGWAINIALAAIAAAKWIFEREKMDDKPNPVKELQSYLRGLKEQYNPGEPNKDLAERHLEHDTLTLEEGVQIVEYLKQSCALQHKSGSPRSESAVLKSWQRYLIIALMIYAPLRQSEIRQLQDQRSLVRSQEGYWVRLPASSSKNGISREFLLPSHLTQDLDKWLKDLRPAIKTEHHYVFIRTGSGRVPESLGQPLTARDISTLTTTAIYKATAVLFGTPKQITPHDLYCLVITRG